MQYYGVTGVDDVGNQVEVYPTSAAVWQQVHPEGLYDLLMDLLIDYPDAPPLVITENGIPDPTSEGTTDDPERLEFLRAHLQQAARAIGDGVRLRRLLRVVAAGQLRVGRGDEPALGARARRLRDPGADAQGERGVVLVGGPRERGGAVPEFPLCASSPASRGAFTTPRRYR